MIQLTDRTLAGFLDASLDAMVAVDDAGMIVLVNARSERLFGYRRQQLIGRPVTLLVRNADPHFRSSALDLQLPGQRKDGSEFSASIRFSTIATDSGLLRSVTIRDATEQIEVEAELVWVKSAAEHLWPRPIVNALKLDLAVMVIFAIWWGPGGCAEYRHRIRPPVAERDRAGHSEFGRAALWDQWTLDDVPHGHSHPVHRGTHQARRATSGAQRVSPARPHRRGCRWRHGGGVRPALRPLVPLGALTIVVGGASHSFHRNADN